MPPSHFTDTSFCPLAGPFRLLYHIELAPNIYRLQASNPGQFYYNVFVTGTPGAPVNVSINIPYPFVTQEGAGVPIQIHDGVQDTNGDGCVEPTPRLNGYTITTQAMVPTSNSGNQIITLEDYNPTPNTINELTTVTVSGTIPGTGLFYVTIHLDYSLKRTGGWTKNGETATGTGAYAGINIAEPQTYNFSFSGTASGSSSPQSVNEFKKPAGFMGFITNSSNSNPTQGVMVRIYSPTGILLGTVYTDEDGFYLFLYKHKAKSATYTVKVPNFNKQQSVTIKANGYGVVNFTVP